MNKKQIVDLLKSAVDGLSFIYTHGESDHNDHLDSVVLDIGKAIILLVSPAEVMRPYTVAFDAGEHRQPTLEYSGLVLGIDTTTPTTKALAMMAIDALDNSGTHPLCAYVKIWSDTPITFTMDNPYWTDDSTVLCCDNCGDFGPLINGLCFSCF